MLQPSSLHFWILSIESHDMGTWLQKFHIQTQFWESLYAVLFATMILWEAYLFEWTDLNSINLISMEMSEVQSRYSSNLE